MADQKLTELAALASPTTDDLLYVVDDPAGTPASRQATIAAVLAIAVPTGGTAGQVLTKDSGTDFDTSWGTPASGGVTVLDSSRPNITVTNSTTETDVYLPPTIAGGTLGTHGCLRLRLIGSKLKNTGGVESMSVFVYWGGSAIFSIAVPNVTVDSATLNSIQLDVDICGDGATGAQIAHCRLVAATHPTTGATTTLQFYTTASVDSTANQTLKVAWKNSVNTNVHAYTSQHGLVTVE